MSAHPSPSSSPPIAPTASSVPDQTATVPSSQPSQPQAQPTSTSAGSTDSSSHDTLQSLWKTMATSLVKATQKADKAAAAANTEVDRETDEYVKEFLKARYKWGRTLTAAEAELEGQALELHALQHYVRTLPTARKKRRLDQDDVVSEVHLNATLKEDPDDVAPLPDLDATGIEVDVPLPS